MAELNPYRAPGAAVTVADSGDLTLASRWRRLFGALVDTFFLTAWVAAEAAIYRFGGMEIGSETAETGEEWGDILAMLWTPESPFEFALGAGTFLLLNGALLWMRGQTLGKLVLGMRIVDLAGGKADFGKILLLRELPVWLANILPLVGVVYGFLDAIFIFRSDKRCLHDLFAGTKVVLSR